jgi:sec-independent protein translocase protein TatC
VVKPFLDHMEDLRWTLIKCVVWCYRRDEHGAVAAPSADEDPGVSGGQGERGGRSEDHPAERQPDRLVHDQLEGRLFVGLIFALPFILYFIAEFVLPALTKKEKRMLAPVFIVGLILFLSGAAVSYV